MSGLSSNGLWSDNPNAPHIPYKLYLDEKTVLAGFLIAIVLHGIVVVLFFQCMHALLNPINRRLGGISWGIVAHTVAMFSSLTVAISMDLNVQSVAYIDNREFSSSKFGSGPLGYQSKRFHNVTVSYVLVACMFPLNQLLADGFLLYRCYIIHAKNKWVIAIPSLMYLATAGVGIVFIYEAVQPSKFYHAHVNMGLVYFAICVALNALLTLMIITRLLFHRRNIQKAVGASAGVGGLYTSIVTMLVESAALYAVVFLFYIGSWAADNSVVNVFNALIGQVQVIAPFLITKRVISKKALTSDMILSGTSGSMVFEVSTHDDGALSEGDQINSTDMGHEVPGLGGKATVEEIPI